MTDIIIGSDKAERSFMDVERVQRTYTLSDWSQEYKLFTPALFYWGTKLDRDIISDFTNQHITEKADHIRMLVLDNPVFRMRDPVLDLQRPRDVLRIDFSRTLYLCPKTVLKRMDAYLTAFAIIDNRSGFYARPVRAHDMPIIDVHYRNLYNKNAMKTVEVLGYHLYTNRYCNIWKNKYYDPTFAPIATRLPTKPTMVSEADNIRKEM